MAVYYEWHDSIVDLALLSFNDSLHNSHSSLHMVVAVVAAAAAAMVVPWWWWLRWLNCPVSLQIRGERTWNT
jgi:hypothetical protein